MTGMDSLVTVEILLWIVGGMAAVAMGNVGWTAKSRSLIHKRINQLGLKMAENYATNASLAAMEGRLSDHLKVIEAKVDQRNGGRSRAGL